MLILQEILYNYPDQKFVMLEGLDDAVIGVDQNLDRLVYSITDIIDIYIQQGMSHEEAIDYYEYTTARATPFIDNGPILVYLNFY
jgi:hypothetical protein